MRNLRWNNAGSLSLMIVLRENPARPRNSRPL